MGCVREEVGRGLNTRGGRKEVNYIYMWMDMHLHICTHAISMSSDNEY